MSLNGYLVVKMFDPVENIFTGFKSLPAQWVKHELLYDHAIVFYPPDGMTTIEMRIKSGDSVDKQWPEYLATIKARRDSYEAACQFILQENKSHDRDEKTTINATGEDADEKLSSSSSKNLNLEPDKHVKPVKHKLVGIDAKSKHRLKKTRKRTLNEPEMKMAEDDIVQNRKNAVENYRDDVRPESVEKPTEAPKALISTRMNKAKNLTKSSTNAISSKSNESKMKGVNNDKKSEQLEKPNESGTNNSNGEITDSSEGEFAEDSDDPDFTLDSVANVEVQNTPLSTLTPDPDTQDKINRDKVKTFYHKAKKLKYILNTKVARWCSLLERHENSLLSLLLKNNKLSIENRGLL